MQLIFYKKQVIFGGATGLYCSKICSRRGEKNMKFCDKLLDLRKKNNMSQEQLADKLGISRQAVSKWESGSSVPDMEKMMQLCKILNCSLDELVDDGVGGNKRSSTEGKTSWNDYYKEVLDFITKTLNMFWSMRLVEKVKCLLEMAFLALICWFILTIVGNFIHQAFYPLLTMLPNSIYNGIYYICSFVYRIFGLVVSFVLLVHIFKIRYLDYFITVEDLETKEKTIEEPIEDLESSSKEEVRKFSLNKKNKIIIRDPKHSTYGFFGILAKVVVYFIKFMFICFAIPCIFCFVAISFLEICSILYLKNGLFFLGTTIAITGALIINFLVLKMSYYFIFELKYSFQKIFIWFIIGLAFIGFGSGASFCTYLTFDKISFENEEKEKITKEITYQDNLVLDFLENENINIVEENDLQDIILEIEHLKGCNLELYSSRHITDSIYENNLEEQESFLIYQLDIYTEMNDIDELNYLLDFIINKKRMEIQDESYQITIKASKTTLEKLKNNYHKFYNNHDEVEYDY